MGIVRLILQLYMLAILVRIVLSWFPIGSNSPIAPVNSFLFSITEPVLGPIRRAIPPVRIGGFGLDLSAIIVLLALQILIAYL